MTVKRRAGGHWHEPSEEMPAYGSILQRLQSRWTSSNSLLCVGLDPVAERLPGTLATAANGYRDFCCAIVDATASEVCAFKPQIANFAAVGAESQLAEVIEYIHARHPDIPVILDAKRGDIGTTAEFYAREAFARYGADIVTVNAYLGPESLEPFLAYPGRGMAVVCRTSNPGSAWLQDHPPEDPIFLRMAKAVSEHEKRADMMLVAGATYTRDLARIRAVAGSIPLLVPGVGAQGGDVRAVLEAGLDANGQGLVINSSRSILYAGTGDFAAAAYAAANSLRETINGLAGEIMHAAA